MLDDSFVHMDKDKEGWAIPLVTNHDVEVHVRCFVCARCVCVSRGWLPACDVPTQSQTILARCGN